MNPSCKLCMVPVQSYSERESEGRKERDGRIKAKDGREEDRKGKQRRIEGRSREKEI